MAHRSDSAAQRAAEDPILALVGIKLGVELERNVRVAIAGATVNVDGSDSSRKIFVEACARQGPLASSHHDKFASDVLKLDSLGAAFPGSTLVIAVVDRTAERWLTGRSWVASIVREKGIRVVLVDLPNENRAAIANAQIAQKMPSHESPVSNPFAPRSAV